MAEIVLLDAGPLGMISHPRASHEIARWLARLLSSGTEVLVPEIADYEVRRALLRICRVTLGAALVAAAMCAPMRADDTQTYESAVASLAAGHRDATVLAGYKTLKAAGIKAFPVLIAHVKDTVRAGGHFEEARIDRHGNIEQPTVGDVCYRLVQHEVEGDWPKGFRDNQVLTKDSVTTWWETHRGRKTGQVRYWRVRRAKTKVPAVIRARVWSYALSSGLTSASSAERQVEDCRAVSGVRRREMASFRP